MKHLTLLWVVALMLTLGMVVAGCKSEDKPKADDYIVPPPPAPAQPVGGARIGGALLNLNIPASSLVLDRIGQVKEEPGQLEVKDRQYEADGAFPFTFNGSALTASSLKVISNLKIQAGAGQHQGTIDVDLDVLPAVGHLTLQYQGNATMTGSTITSTGTFKTVKATGVFASAGGSGTYNMTVVESAQTLMAPATVQITATAP